MDKSKQNKTSWLIDGASVSIVVVIAVLLALPQKADLGEWTRVLPHVIGSVNSITILVLLFALYFVKKGRIELHRYAMTTAFTLGVVFLVSYVIYHLSNPSSKIGAEGTLKLLYLAILASHILLSLVVLPLVLRAFYFALTGQFSRHKRTVRYAYPIWLYVSATGVAVYLMVHQFYPSG